MKILSHLLLAILLSTFLFSQDNVNKKLRILLQAVLPSKDSWLLAMTTSA